MNKEYFIEKLDDLKNLHQNKFKNIEDILEKCNKHEMEIYEKIKHLNEENFDCNFNNNTLSNLCFIIF